MHLIAPFRIKPLYPYCKYAPNHMMSHKNPYAHIVDMHLFTPIRINPLIPML